MTILLDDIGLSLLDVFTDIPDMDWVAVPSYQPHLIDININPTNSQKQSGLSPSSKLAQMPLTTRIQQQSYQYYSELITPNTIVNNNTVFPSITHMNHLSELFAKSSSQPTLLKASSKEEFFTIKKIHKRIKPSLSISGTLDSFQQSEAELDLSVNTSASNDSSKLENKELDSTIAEEPLFSFKAKPPKRKLNVRSPLKEYQSLSIQKDEPQLTSLLEQQNNKQAYLQQNCSRSPQLRQGRNIKIADFRLLSKIGQGSYSEVFLAIHKLTGFLCALKVLEKSRMREEGVQSNVVSQLKINSFLQHPNIAKLYGFFEETKYIILICEYSTDRNLYETLYQPKLKLKKGFKNSQAAALAKQICSAVEYLHLNHVIHRDIKPENILLTMTNTIKICDFGWSIYNPTSSLRNTLCGTPLYLAPELITQKQYNESIDIWAIGIITYEMLTQQIPFDIGSPDELYRIVCDEIKIHRIRNREAADFIEKALEKDAKKRISISQLTQHPFVN